jgi:putative transposase
MNKSNIYNRYRFPSEIIQYAVWIYYRFDLSHRDIEDLLAERGINVTYEAIRLWCNRFGPKYADRLKRNHRGYGEVVDVYLQKRRDGAAAKRFFKRLLKVHRDEPRKIVTDKLRSYGVAHRELIPDTIHDTSQYANNRAELSHQPTRVRERGMRKFKSIVQAQRFLGVHSAVYNLFNLGRHLISASHYRLFRMRAFASWKDIVA